MLDFLLVSYQTNRDGSIEVYPKFIIKRSDDLMIRGGDFYAIWIEQRGLWSTDEQDAIRLIDAELDEYAQQKRKEVDVKVKVSYMWDSASGMIDRWHKYCQKQMRDNFHQLDENLIFSNVETKKEDFATKRLSYPLEPGDISSYDKLMSVLYTPKEREKIEWAIGAIVSGDSKKIQKFMVMYGAAGTGKSTVLNIIQKLFDGYYSVFDAKALGSSSNSFALESFKSNPLVAIQHDGDLSRIEDNTRLNSLVSHELMTVNEKFKSTYSSQFNAFLIMGTNKPVKITDGKSGLIRRLIDVTPSGEKIPPKEYKSIVKRIDFELGPIACHCRDVYLSNPGLYDDYIPTLMLGASNDFYNYVLDAFPIFKNEDGVTLKQAWELYKTFCDETKVPYPLSQRSFKEELRNYFKEYTERAILEDGTRVRSYFHGFRSDKFDNDLLGFEQIKTESKEPGLKLESTNSIFDKECADCLAQYANSKETPSKKWENVKTKLSSLDTTKIHYVKVPENHIVIDFDIPGPDGTKDQEANLKEAAKWPPTYAEFSKSGSGVHLHYIYTGDPSKLSRVFDDHVEVKVFTGKSSLRRRLTKCNDLPIAKISSGLPLKGEDKMVNFDAIKSEKGLRTLIKRNLNKEIHPNTKPSIDFIDKILDDAYKSGLKYDVTDMRNAILAFAASSTHQAEACIKLVNKMHFKSEDPSTAEIGDESELIFYDVEVFPNLFLVNWKAAGDGNKVVRMINPTPSEIEKLMQYRLVGFNCRRYDNHILYGRLMGYTNEQLYSLSKKIVSGSRNAFFGEAYNVSYTDVYDFSAKKQSLKKFEIELGIHHQELGLPWDEPVPEEMWPKVAEYCDNDVIATEAVFNARKADFEARQVLAKIAGGTVNDTTNTLTTRLIFGSNRHPQDQFVYTDLSTIFPGYVYDHGKSTYRDEETGEGGYVYSESGMYENVALLDIMSMHPHSIIALNLFGDKYTKRFEELVHARIAIKHKDIETLKTIFGGAFAEFINASDDELKNLASALKIAINSVYGLTSAKFDNPFRDVRNKDNIVAKRGALFMINLKHEVQKRGFTVAHVKTDSIKIPNATPEIIKFVSDYGAQYGYYFEHEATYNRMCLVNDAVYIAKYENAETCKKQYGYIPGDCVKHGGQWTATGAQFAVPYTFKTLFSKESIEFKDLCETKSVSTSLYLDMNEGHTPQPEIEKELSDRAKLVKTDDHIAYVNPIFKNASTDELEEILKCGHNYVFVGRVGQFCPIKPGCGGGLLMREKDGKYYSATGAKGYRWLESEMVKELGKEDDIDRSYYNKLVDDAVANISQYGDFEQFVSD